MTCFHNHLSVNLDRTKLQSTHTHRDFTASPVENDGHEIPATDIFYLYGDSDDSLSIDHILNR